MSASSGIDPHAVARIVLDLVASALLGGTIGAQRQATHKPAGFRTHLLVALGSCAFMEISQIVGDTRVAAGVVTGIGFLGAGAIVREGILPRGLTTAASIWAAAAVGLALGYGSPVAYVLGATTTLLVFVALAVSDKWLDRTFPPSESVSVTVTFDIDALQLADVHALFASHGTHVKNSDRLAILREGTRRTATWHLSVRSKGDHRLRDSLVAISQHPAIASIDTERIAQP